MTLITLWIDADAIPNPTRELIFRAAKRLQIPVRLVANQPQSVPLGPLIQSIVVSQGPDEADNYIATHVAPFDLVITHDIPLAARIIEQNAAVLSPRGHVFTEDNIRERLSIRNFMHELREVGVQTGGPPAFSSTDRQHFANALDRLLTRQLRLAQQKS